MNEIEFYKKANHPFIIDYIDSFPAPFKDDPARRMCIVLEHADGCDLRSKLNSLN